MTPGQASRLWGGGEGSSNSVANITPPPSLSSLQSVDRLVALNQTLLGLSVEDFVNVQSLLNDSNPNNLWNTLRNISIGAQVTMVTILL